MSEVYPEVGPQPEPEQTFHDLFAMEYAAVVRLVFALTGRRHIAEELTQEAFLEAHRRWDRISRFDDPGSWVRRVAVNRAISSRRRAVTEVKLLVRLRAAHPAEPELEHDAAELWAQVRALPRRQAQVVALRFLEDRSVAEIASLLGCGEETVRTHLRRARATLADRLAPPVSPMDAETSSD